MGYLAPVCVRWREGRGQGIVMFSSANGVRWRRRFPCVPPHLLGAPGSHKGWKPETKFVVTLMGHVASPLPLTSLAQRQAMKHSTHLMTLSSMSYWAWGS